LLSLRWCICDAIPQVPSTIGVHVLMHRQEQFKPSSTGTLIERAVQGAQVRVYQRGYPLQDSDFISSSAPSSSGKLLVLHPLGEPFPSPETLSDFPPRRVLLLDGNWRQARKMLTAVVELGRCVRLPMMGPSRYWLRAQHEVSYVSTAEALLGVCAALGDSAAEDRFRLHFELHVYASLLARGRQQLARDYLQHSPLTSAIPEFLEQLASRKPIPEQ